MKRVKDKIAVVTGGAQGIGCGIAKRLVSEGAIVIITDLNAELGRSIQESSSSISFIAHNVTVESDWKKVLESVSKQYGKIDILVNNAGILATEDRQQIENTSLEQWRAVHSVNSDGVFLGCKHGIAVMKKTGGTIINMSSVAGIMGSPSLIAYGASKAAVRQLTKSVAIHCGQKNYKIRCNSVHPGIILTTMGDQVMRVSGGNFEERCDERIAQIPLGEAGTIYDIANSVLFLASDEAQHITGAELVVDGGRITF